MVSMLKAVMLGCAVMLVVLLSARARSGQTEKPSQWAIDNALIGPDSPIEVPAGGSYQAKVMYPVPDGPLFPLKADVTWWIEPAVKGILIEAKTGTIIVATTVPRGTSALLHADVTGRKEKLHAKLYVYSPKLDPMVGNWRVVSSQTCSPRPNESPVAQTATGNEADWKFHFNKEFWIGQEFGIRAGTQQYGTYEYSSLHSALKLIPKWPANRAQSHWKVALNEMGDSAQLTLREHSGHNAVCSYVLRRAQRGD
jgi:hypothetical protein